MHLIGKFLLVIDGLEFFVEFVEGIGDGFVIAIDQSLT